MLIFYNIKAITLINNIILLTLLCMHYAASKTKSKFKYYNNRSSLRNHTYIFTHTYTYSPPHPPLPARALDVEHFFVNIIVVITLLQFIIDFQR